MRAQDRETLCQMRDAAIEVAEHLGGADFAAYLSDRKLRRAVERCVSIVGEAAYRLRLAGAQGLEQLGLRQVERMRHVIVHGYDRARDDLVYEAASLDCPKLVLLLDAVLEENP
jgi:uncharacterized protein with HEPN domain